MKYVVRTTEHERTSTVVERTCGMNNLMLAIITKRNIGTPLPQNKSYLLLSTPEDIQVPRCHTLYLIRKSILPIQKQSRQVNRNLAQITHILLLLSHSLYFLVIPHKLGHNLIACSAGTRSVARRHVSHPLPHMLHELIPTTPSCENVKERKMMVKGEAYSVTTPTM